MTNDLQPDTINNMVSGKLWNWISLEIDVSPKYRLGTVAIQCLANICFPPTWISDLDSNTLHKMLRVVFQENLFHSRGWLGERWVERKSVWSQIFKITGIAESNFEISQTHPSLTSNILPHENHNLPRNYLRHPTTGCFSGDIFDWMTCGRWQIKPCQQIYAKPWLSLDHGNLTLDVDVKKLSLGLSMTDTPLVPK